MDYIVRKLEQVITSVLENNKSILLLGPRQVGKTTLMGRLPTHHYISFINPQHRQEYEKNPSLLTAQIEALAEKTSKKLLVVIDEVQKVPSIMDVVQDLIDRHIAQFILSGSSARKLRKQSQINFLPGRVIVLRLDPLIFSEIPKNYYLEDLLLYGSLPEIATTIDSAQKLQLLDAYTVTYLEEEVRAEAIVRNIAPFARFLELAASESGQLVNFTKLSQEIGVAHTTIASYYQVLEDCLIAERVEPLIKTKTRRKLTKSAKYLFFDLGVRNAAMGLTHIAMRDSTSWGKLFEHNIGLELIRSLHLLNLRAKLYFWRDANNGPEVDWVIQYGEKYIPIEVKWTDSPSLKDTKYLQVFMQEYQVDKAYVVCRVRQPAKLAENIYAIPWQELEDYIIKELK